MPPKTDATERILVIDDDPGLRRLIEKRLRRAGREPFTVHSAAEALNWLQSNSADLILLDLKLPDAVGADLIERLETLGKLAPFIVATGQGDERVAVEMMKRGALDYLVKDTSFLDTLPPVVDRALAQRRTEKRLAAAEQQVRLIQAAVEEMQDAVLIVTAGNSAPEIVYGNPAFYRINSVSPDEIEGRPLEVLQPYATATLRRALDKNEILAGENRIVRPNGDPLILDCRVAPIRDAAGNITHWVSIQRDITKRKLAEEGFSTRGRQQAAVALLGNHVLSGIGFDALLDETAHLLVETLDASFSKIMERLPDGQGFLLRAGAGWRPGYVGVATSHPKNSPAALAIDSREPVIYENLPADTRINSTPYLLEHHVLSGITVPIYDRDGTFGILGVDSREARRFTKDDIHFLQAIANVVSGALERRRSEKEILDASVREQQRIGQDLHDGLGQHLTGIEILSHILEEELAEQNLPQARQAGKIAARVREAISHTRYLARGLSPVHIEGDGLMTALQEFSANVEEIFKVRCQFQCPKPVYLDDHNVATHLYRIAQEATNNAIKHGKAKNIVISLARKKGIRLEISDDGTGFSATSDRTGIGLRIMNRRATMMGGKFEISPRPEGGLKASCNIPAKS